MHRPFYSNYKHWSLLILFRLNLLLSCHVFGFPFPSKSTKIARKKVLCQTSRFCYRNESELKSAVLSGDCNLLNTYLWKPPFKQMLQGQVTKVHVYQHQSSFLPWKITMRSQSSEVPLSFPSSCIMGFIMDGKKNLRLIHFAHPMQSFLLPGYFCSDIYE